jgi:hypothetical protein
VSPLTTIEEQEDRRTLEKAQKQLRRESLARGKKEEFDIGRTTSLSPDQEKPEQILPLVTVQGSGGTIGDGEKNGTKNGNGYIPPNKEVVKSPVEETNLGKFEKSMQSEVSRGRHVSV